MPPERTKPLFFPPQKFGIDEKRFAQYVDEYFQSNSELIGRKKMQIARLRASLESASARLEVLTSHSDNSMSQAEIDNEKSSTYKQINKLRISIEAEELNVTRIADSLDFLAGYKNGSSNVTDLLNELRQVFTSLDAVKAVEPSEENGGIEEADALRDSTLRKIQHLTSFLDGMPHQEFPATDDQPQTQSWAYLFSATYFAWLSELEFFNELNQ
jgi:hypothetical protein